MNERKVLFIITCDLLRGGITSVMLNHVKNAVEYEYDLAVAGSADPDIVRQFENEGVRVYTFKKYPNVLRYARQLRKLIQNNNYSVVHVHGCSNTMSIELQSARKAGCPVRVAHSHNTTCKNKLLNRLLKPNFNGSFTHAVACGVEAGKWLFGDKTFFISKNGIDTSAYRFDLSIRTELRNKLGVDDGDVILANVAMFTEAKNHVFLLDMFAELCKAHQNYKLLLIGSGPLRSVVEQKIAELGLERKVVLLGEVDNVREWLNAIDLIVMPSLFEGFPLALVEEQANGLHCIVSDVITDDVNISGNVDFQKTDDISRWVNAVVGKSAEYDRARASDDAISAICRAGYDSKTTAKEIEDIYNKAIAERRQGGR